LGNDVHALSIVALGPAEFVIDTAVHLLRLIAKFIEAFIYPGRAFGAEIVFLHGDVKEVSVFSFVQ
jgi:hypothetical protein